jgi:ATP-dependent exoDNAse (exonuclease V) beta subunit
MPLKNVNTEDMDNARRRLGLLPRMAEDIDRRDKQQQDRLNALEGLNVQLKNKAKREFKAKTSPTRKRDDRATASISKQKEARNAKTASNRAKKAKAVVDKLIKEEAKDGGVDFSDFTFEQLEALKTYGGLTSNMTREQIDEVLSRVSPLTEDGTPFVITTPVPVKRYLFPRRLKVKDIKTGREIVL